MKRILITVTGGIAEVDQATIPEGIEVEIRDFDVIVPSLETKQDDAGDYYEETLWIRVE